jgi:hypothetical protein
LYGEKDDELGEIAPPGARHCGRRGGGVGLRSSDPGDLAREEL